MGNPPPESQASELLAEGEIPLWPLELLYLGGTLGFCWNWQGEIQKVIVFWDLPSVARKLRDI